MALGVPPVGLLLLGAPALAAGPTVAVAPPVSVVVVDVPSGQPPSRWRRARRAWNWR
jgi:hypothetical protein